MKFQALMIPVGLMAGAFVLVAAEKGESSWKKQVATSDFLTEGASAGDIDGDGKIDLVAGAFWFKGPDFKQRQQFREGGVADVKTYQEDSFLSWVDDLNGDGKNDILMASHPGKNLTLYLNSGKPGMWSAHVVMTEAATESPLWMDLDGDGKKELICMQGGKFGYAEVDWNNVTKPWKFIAISEKRTDTPYIHGLGVGDLNGDKKPDILAKDGWFEQPSDHDGKWIWHPVEFSGPGGSQMLVFDADGDGDNDIVTSWNAHGYGLAWFENTPKQDAIEWVKHEILPEDPNKTGVGGLQFSQLHSLEMADFNGDGRMDFVTGKRFLAHNGHDPGTADPALTVVFLNQKSDDGVQWKPVIIDPDTGVGCQVVATDINGDHQPDIVVGNKKGLTIFTNPSM
ncbi:VCBS repeat-containing protein [Luteolibacter pohnpeiensis]|uniref:VCBS repeat-containing protein n=1 Tax=Luteolibacter pohnpeiensis TaxID=454153 RepID=A0A934S6N2_9BACT|nr:VCBS repeat-containing protein [Luteolibacter pohnpeiensis]MBK1883616.1 VCBS repeat-containing protein [Luteolibacter pohnpeiensis]